MWRGAFGRHGLRLYELARGIDNNQIVPKIGPPNHFPQKIRFKAMSACLKQSR